MREQHASSNGYIQRTDTRISRRNCNRRREERHEVLVHTVTLIAEHDEAVVLSHLNKAWKDDYKFDVTSY